MLDHGPAMGRLSGRGCGMIVLLCWARPVLSIILLMAALLAPVQACAAGNAADLATKLRQTGQITQGRVSGAELSKALRMLAAEPWGADRPDTLNIIDVVISGNLDLPSLQPRLVLSNVEFLEDGGFSAVNAQFDNGLVFSKVRTRGSLVLSGAKVSGSVVVDGLRGHQLVVDGARIDRLSITSTQVQSIAAGALVAGSVLIASSAVSDDINLSGARVGAFDLRENTLRGTLWLNQSVLGTMAAAGLWDFAAINLVEATVCAGLRMDGLRGGDVLIQMAKLLGDAGIVPQSVRNLDLKRTLFGGKVSIAQGVVMHDLDLEYIVATDPTKGLDLNDMQVLRRLIMVGAWVAGSVQMIRSDVTGFVDLHQSQVRYLNLFNESTRMFVSGGVDMRGMVATHTHIEDVTFHADVDVSGARFGAAITGQSDEVTRNLAAAKAACGEWSAKGEPSPPLVEVQGPTSFLASLTFDGNAYFSGTSFAGMTVWDGLRFKHLADFTSARVEGTAPRSAAWTCSANGRRQPAVTHGFEFSNVAFEAVRLELKSLPPLERWAQDDSPRILSSLLCNSFGIDFSDHYKPRQPLPQALDELEAVLRRGGNSDDANDILFWRKSLSWRENIPEAALWGWTSGWKTKPLWVIGWMAFFLALFALVFALVGGLERHHPTAPTTDFEVKLRLLDIPRHYLKGSNPVPPDGSWQCRVATAFWFSAVLLLKVGYRDIHAGPPLSNRGLAWLVALEWALGYVLIAILVSTLSQSWPWLNQMISGVF
jgi:hypothetical protein